MSDEMTAQFYEDPQNLAAAGPAKAPRRRAPGRLSSHVPIRFDSVVIGAVKMLADEDGMTVSSWIRRLVDREVTRRLSARNETGGTVIVAPFQPALLPATANRLQEAVG